jgi:hypothetical protein
MTVKECIFLLKVCRNEGARPDFISAYFTLCKNTHGNFLKCVYNNDVVWVYVVVHFLPHNKHVFLLLRPTD